MDRNVELCLSIEKILREVIFYLFEISAVYSILHQMGREDMEMTKVGAALCSHIEILSGENLKMFEGCVIWFICTCSICVKF